MKKTILMVSIAGLSVAAEAQTESTPMLEEVLVLGRAQQFYLEKTTSIGTKVAVDILELPQSAQILSEQLMRDQAARNITDMYRSIAGVSEFSYSGVTFRGFRDSNNVFYDGVRGDPYTGFGVPQLFNVERVEVLKGPAAALYGGGEPGGMINYVTKAPSFEDSTELRLTLGDYDTAGASVDSRGGMTDSIAYRLGVFYEKSDSFRNNADAIDMEIAGGLLFELSDRTQLTTTFDLIRQDLGGNRLRGVPVNDAGVFLIDPSYNANESADYQDMEAKVFQAVLSHSFSDRFSVNTTLRYLDNERYQGYHESREWVDVNNDGKADIHDKTIKREYRLQKRANEEVSVTTDFVYKFTTGIAEHQFLFGGDYHDVDSDYDYQRARYEADGVANLNIFNLNYGITDPSTYKLKKLKVDGALSTRYGFYLQDQITLDERWVILAGLRYDNFDDQDKKSTFSFKDSHVTPRMGVVYKLAEDDTVYFNYSESFKPVSIRQQESVSEDGNLNPEEGNQLELGFKNRWLDGQVMSSVAIYHINKENVALSNPNDTGPGDGIPALINLGEVESRGLELTLVGDITENWTMTANYAYNKTEVTKGVEDASLRNTFGDGSKFVNAPEHQAGLWTRYALPNLSSAVAFGANYVAEQFSFNGQRVKPFATFDASWTTTFDAIEMQLNVSNLFDKRYAVSGFSRRNGHFPGSPREVILQISYNL